MRAEEEEGELVEGEVVVEGVLDGVDGLVEEGVVDGEVVLVLEVPAADTATLSCIPCWQ